jgi:DNA-binding LacI/PurR family transcriptional regulator
MKENQQHNTILDLAAALKLSPATVSRALNNTSYVKAETKQRVLEMAVKLGYRKNTMAAGLRNNRTNTIGLILPKISMYFHSAVVTVIQNLLHAQGYNLIIGQSNDDPAMEKELAETFFSSRVDALIVSCTLKTEDFSHFDIFTAHQVPILFYDRVPPAHYRARVIKGDDFNGGFLAGKHLAASGCQHIGLICGPLTSNLYQERSEGFLRALQLYQLPVYDELLFYQPLNEAYTRLAMDKMFSGKRKPDALFITSDKNAVTVLQYAKEKEIRIPEDLRVVGYSNDPITAFMTPPITTIDQFPAVFGTQLVKTLTEMMKENQGEKTAAPPVITPVKLIIRNSA